MMGTTSRFDHVALEVLKMSLGDKSETSIKRGNAEVLVFKYLRVSLVG